MESPYLTAVEVATMLRVDPQTVRRWCSTGQLKHIRAGGAIRITKADLDAFVVPPSER